ncbi:hypothetical protein BEP19_15670 [Ammoniphilus oxalaticus]|uniref:GAF domain-containing protein n=1 Tax=Ammoniphilus oxalaticus TaxID=66863 RepID=A0A419SDF8_9BACL|nr:hypothetical protein [Ammoniphilus oxalaticus]RKD21111.1 hypothetical protein BEP19_15670 [Ammoniphilus oxalaticus]
MSDFWKELFARMPDWLLNTAALVIIAAVIIMLFWFILAARKFSETMGNENRVIQLQDDLIIERKQSQINEDISSQAVTTLQNMKNYISALNDIRFSFTYEDPNIYTYKVTSLIQRLIDGLAADVKLSPGERHRCGVWLENNGILKLRYASSGFPENYIGVRELSIEHSLAGKSFRRKQTVKYTDVTEEEDWEKNPASSSDYTALICIPMAGWGVLTIDALKPMRDEVSIIGELYGALIESAVIEFLINDSMANEAAASKEVISEEE